MRLRFRITLSPLLLEYSLKAPLRVFYHRRVRPNLFSWKVWITSEGVFS